MKLFKKKILLKDHYFLKLSLSKAEKQKIQPFLIDEEEKRFFPRVTFESAERIFNALSNQLSDKESFLISKMELVFNQQGVTSTEDELFLTDFEITDDYENVLKPLSEAMFNLMPFSAVPFEDKLNYLKEVFEAWQESIQLGEEHLPLLPDFEWDDEEYVEFTIPFYQNREQELDTILQMENGEATKKTQSEEIIPEIHEMEEIESSEVFPTVVMNVEEQEIPKEVKTIDFSSSSIPKEEKIVFKPYAFSYFQLKTVSPDVTVPLSILEKIETINKEIDQLNQESNTLQRLIFEKKMAQFEAEKKKQLAINLEKQDKRVQLKNEWVHTAARKLQETLDFESKSAKDRENLALLEERKAYELRVATLKHEASLALENKLKQVKKDFKYQIHHELSKVLGDETAQLKEFLDEALLDLHIEMKKEAESVQQELHRLSESQEKTIESYYKENLALPLNVELQFLAKPKEVVSDVGQVQDFSTSQSITSSEIEEQHQENVSDSAPSFSKESEGKAIQESVEELTQDFTRADTEESTHEVDALEVQEKPDELPVHSVGEESIFSALCRQYKEKPILTAVAFVGMLAICLLSFSGGWVLFSHLAK
ncbi:hypothetical protein AALM99_07430 [Lactococcus muris]|uniref:Uncharacterized protein n=1 Tax=Lactococcus muris TaxID=2941330 RepID=A0ABV4DDK7_9LACT